MVQLGIIIIFLFTNCRQTADDELLKVVHLGLNIRRALGRGFIVSPQLATKRQFPQHFQKVQMPLLEGQDCEGTKLVVLNKNIPPSPCKNCPNNIEGQILGSPSILNTHLPPVMQQSSPILRPSIDAVFQRN